jgi:isomerase DpgB
VPAPEHNISAYLTIDGDEPLSTSLTKRVNVACDHIEDADGDVVVLMYLRGPRDPATGSAAGGESGGAWSPELGVHTVNRWERALRRLERLSRLTIAVVDGVCRGPALELLLTTDYRIARPGAVLQMPPPTQAAWPGLALFRVAHQLGAARARQFALLGVALPAERAADAGLVDTVAVDVRAAVGDAVERFAGTSGSEIALRRQLLFDAATTSFEDAVGVHLAACDRTLRLARGDAGLVTAD